MQKKIKQRASYLRMDIIKADFQERKLKSEKNQKGKEGRRKWPKSHVSE